jgi:hypothetical protein
MNTEETFLTWSHQNWMILLRLYSQILLLYGH